MSPEGAHLMAPVGEAGSTGDRAATDSAPGVVTPVALAPGVVIDGRVLELENDVALEMAHRLVGLRAGRAWQQLQVLDAIDAGSRPPIQLAAMPLASIARPSAAAVAASCGAAIAAVELGSSVFGAVTGGVLDAALASIILVLFASRPQAESGRLLPVLALVALIRPISLAIVVPVLGHLLWYAFAGVPLLVGAVLAARLLDEPILELRLRIGRPGLDAAIAAAGLPLGVVGYLLLSPAPLLAHPSAIGYAAMIGILIAFGGLLEELVFRGLVQSAAIHAFGDPAAGVFFAAALGMALYWGSGSVPYMLLMGAVGGAFGMALLRGASLWGIALSHGVMLITLALLAQVVAG